MIVHVPGRFASIRTTPAEELLLFCTPYPFLAFHLRQGYNVNVNVIVNICNALEFPKEQKCEYLLWSIEAKMVQMCFELRSE